MLSDLSFSTLIVHHAELEPFFLSPQQALHNIFGSQSFQVLTDCWRVNEIKRGAQRCRNDLDKCLHDSLIRRSTTLHVSRIEVSGPGRRGVGLC